MEKSNPTANPLCYCGEMPIGHLVGLGHCSRKITPQNLIPTNFRVENGMKVCTVNGYTITEYTLFQQRGYSREENDVWTMPKNEESLNLGDTGHY